VGISLGSFISRLAMKIGVCTAFGGGFNHEMGRLSSVLVDHCCFLFGFLLYCIWVNLECSLFV
jgi:hypothetical protein